MIVIGDGIEISVIEISPTRVKLGVKAPREIPVLRKETIAIAMDNRLAAELVPASGTAGLREIARSVGSLLPALPGISPALPVMPPKGLP